MEKFFYFAPMEGITGYIYRSAHASCFPGMDRYYSPFLVPHQNRDFDTREKNDVLPEHNRGYTLIPQILTNRSEDFLRLSDRSGTAILSHLSSDCNSL